VVSPPVRIRQCFVTGCSTVAEERDMFGWIYAWFG
jgi:hypothetical protein